MDLVLQLLFTGIGIGSVYALVALGFVLIFRATNVVNFSVNGSRTSGNAWTVDGADNVDRGSNFTLLTYPSVDAIAEKFSHDLHGITKYFNRDILFVFEVSIERSFCESGHLLQQSQRCTLIPVHVKYGSGFFNDELACSGRLIHCAKICRSVYFSKRSTIYKMKALKIRIMKRCFP